MIDIFIIGVIFAYALWVLFRYVKKSKKGACASCALNKSCQASCSVSEAALHGSSSSGNKKGI